MKRPIAILLGVALLVSTDAVLARGGRGGGGHAGGGGSHGGGTSIGAHSGHGGGVAAVGFHAGRSVGRPFVGVRPGPVFVGRPHFFHRHRVIVGGAVVVGAPFFYPYPYPYYPPVYAPPPAYTEPPVYIEQGGGVYYYCPDYNDYYPNVSSCPSQWVPVSAAASEYPR
jgi:hypothetical protein